MLNQLVTLVTEPTKESVFKSRRIPRRRALPCSSGRATSSMERRPRRASERMPAPFSSTCEKTAQNYGSIIAFGLTMVLVKSVHTA